MGPVLTFGQRQQALRGLPFYGKSDFNFVASRSNFSGGISIKVLPLSDLSRPQSVNINDFDREINQVIRAFIRDPKTMKLVEVYPETLTRLNESKSHLAKTFLEFVI